MFISICCSTILKQPIRRLCLIQRHPAGRDIPFMKTTGTDLHCELFASDAQKPKYGQIQDRILANIQKGRWAPGDRVPPERQLARMYDASVGTVRNAMQTLVAQGYLSRTQGRGTFVKKSVEHTDSLRYFRFSTDFDAAVQPLSIKCLQGPCRTVRPEVAVLLGHPADAPLFEVQRLFCLGPVPLVYVTTYLPESLFGDFDRHSAETIEEKPLYLLVENIYSMPTLALKERFCAAAADDTVADMLVLKPGTPVMKIMMVAFTTRNTPYEYQISYCNTTEKHIFRDCPGHVTSKNLTHGASHES